MEEDRNKIEVNKLLEWNDILEEVIDAHKDFSHDPNNEKKLKIYQEKWNTAKESATSTDDLSELNRHVPIDHISETHSEAKEKIRTKWYELFAKELPEMENDPYQLIHAYRNAPLREHQLTALEAFIHSVTTEEDARHFHNKEHSGIEICLALEKKFPEMFSEEERVNPEDDVSFEDRVEKTEEESNDDGAD